MSSGLADLTAQANQLVAAGDLAAAHELLDDALSAADPGPAGAGADPELTDAAALQARVLMALGEPHPARDWAAYAYSATTRLYGRSDPRTVAAAATLAAVLHRVGSHARAGHLYREVIIELTATDGPESLRVLAAHADLATVEYARGECQPARDRLRDAWELHREVYGDGHASGLKMLARLGAMQRDCRLLSEGYDNLALARELCRQHLPAGHPLTTQIAALAEAPPDPRHICDTRPAPVTDSPEAPPAGMPLDPADTGPPGAATPDPEAAPGWWPPEPAGGPARYDEPARDDDAAGHHARTGHHGSTGHDRPVGYDEPTAHHEPTGHDRPVGYDEPTGYDRPAGHGEPAGYDQPRYAPAQHPPARAESDGVWRMPALPARREPAGLPVPVPPPPRAPSRRLAPVVFAGLLAVLLGAIIVVAGFALVAGPGDESSGGGGAPPPAGSPGSARSPAASSAPGPAAPGAPPTEVRLRDGRDRITLSWTYPPGAEGPVVLSGARTGQDLRAFYELPAGATSYIVYDLDRNTNYCFSVAVVYSVDTIGRAEPVCTSRPDASGG